MCRHTADFVQDVIMEMSPVQAMSQASRMAEAAGIPLLDRPHLHHQTLGDKELARIVLGLFLDEAPRYAADIASARDAKAWKMAVHTLKGVALNIGAFPLAQLCRECENPGCIENAVEPSAAAIRIGLMIDRTAAAIRDVLSPGHAI
jgi:hypothetical protein